jgi:hypothetical protein
VGKMGFIPVTEILNLQGFKTFVGYTLAPAGSQRPCRYRLRILILEQLILNQKTF